MTQQFGVDRKRADERGDAFAEQVDSALRRVARWTARNLSPVPTELDLAGVRGTWRDQVTVTLLPMIECEWRRAADETWQQVADALPNTVTAGGKGSGRYPKGSGGAGIGTRETHTKGFSSTAELKSARDLAVSKSSSLPAATDADRKLAEERHARSSRHGGDDRPGSVQRKKLRQGLLDEFGDGEKCPCLNCGINLDITNVSLDRIIPGADNGRYVSKNLIPMDYNCNRARSDDNFADMASEWS